MQHIAQLAGLALLLVTASAEGSQYPEPLASQADISLASADTDDIQIAKLPLADYPQLVKFRALKGARFHSRGGTGADDMRLQALSRIGLTNLFDIGLLNCPQVTDRGIEHLVQLPALRYLQLEGTSITDAGCKTLASKRSVTGVNVANCTNVTLKGILELARSESLDELSFSFRGLTQDDVIRVIGELRNAKWCGIIDPKGDLDADAVRRAGESRGIKVGLHAQGALPTFLGEKPREWAPKATQKAP